MRILGIETSCDETACALLKTNGSGSFVLKKNIVASQIDIHRATGGVVPEVAARNHILTLLPVIERACGGRTPDALAVTAGPGLVTSLLVGVETARALSYAWRVPLIPINHLEGHIYANWLEKQFTVHSSQFTIFPALVLLVSGGHTELILMKGHGTYQLLGATRDDAAGEAFDKGAKILGLGYPGGPAISQRAEQGNRTAFSFPRPMMRKDSYEFSFSGLKTALLYCVRDLPKNKRNRQDVVDDLCASYQEAIVDVLIEKTVRAVKEFRPHALLLGGGVAASARLREEMEHRMRLQDCAMPLFFPQPKHCTDNAAMIAVAGYFRYSASRSKTFPWQKVSVMAGARL